MRTSGAPGEGSGEALGQMPARTAFLLVPAAVPGRTRYKIFLLRNNVIKDFTKIVQRSSEFTSCYHFFLFACFLIYALSLMTDDFEYPSHTSHNIDCFFCFVLFLYMFDFYAIPLMRFRVNCDLWSTT